MAVITITNSGSAFRDNTVIGGSYAWDNVTAASLNDTVYASASMPAATQGATHYLYAQNFGFAIPTNATINGISASVNRYALYSAAARYVWDYNVSLIKGTATTGSNKAYNVLKWPSSASMQIYGGSSDLWNAAWSPSDINSASFGLAISACITQSTGTGFAYIDWISLGVTYTEAAAVGPSQAVRTYYIFRQGRA